MKKKILSIFLCIALGISMIACGTSEVSEDNTENVRTEEQPITGTETVKEVVTLVYAEVNPLDTIAGQTAKAFKEKVEELSKGEILIDVQHSAVLGSENEVIEYMLEGAGTIDLARISAFALTNYGGEKSKLLSLPYTFVNREHFWMFATSDLAEEFLLEPHENGSGVRGLFYGEEGFRHFFGTEPISSIEDLAGKNIRVSEDPVMVSLVECLGATPTEVPFGELYTALSRGTVDAAEQPISNYQSNAFDEVAGNVILDGHTLGAIQVIITDEAWDKLTAEQQEILMQAGAYASEVNRSISKQMEEEVLAELKAAGCNVVEVSDNAPWKAAVESLIAEQIAGMEELYQQILDMQ
ncbi:MAG: TRAP transporter substrate-binding protein [Roseburia sp.]|nr:TRAP transporter substrate-binding protein [Roseburia sp.]